MSFPVVVTGNTTDPNFAVSSFLAPPAPSIAVVPTNFTGCVVDCSGTLAAVGSYGSGQVAIYDLSNPAAPQLQGTVPSTISAIGALSLDGNNLLVGELNGSSLVLIDISTISSPQYTTPATNPNYGSISAVVLKGPTAIVCGPGGFGVLNIGTMATAFYPSPISAGIGNPFVPGTCDFDGSTAVFADSGSDNIFVFSISGGNASYQAASTTGLNPPGLSIAILGNQTAVGQITSPLVWLGGITLGVPVSTTESLAPGAGVGGIGASGVGALKFLAGQPYLAVGTNNGVSLFSPASSGWPSVTAATPIGWDNANLAPTTLGFTVVPVPQGCINALKQFLGNPLKGWS
ncbi:MAG: hypothetical protein ACLPND_08745 [Candidatus Korobacteraceae bacterium]|jgi:hypothetical protein